MKLGKPLAALGLLGGAHFVIDLTATTISPLWPALEDQLSLERGGLLWAFVAWSIATSLTQLGFGWMADRGRGRWLIWAGPLTATAGLSCVGIVHSPLMFAALLIVSGLGIAAFHPEAAATAGSLAPEHRSRMLAVFALSGYLGQAVGPYYSGRLTDAWGLAGLLWTAAWAGPALVVLSWARLARRDPRDRPPDAAPQPSDAAAKGAARPPGAASLTPGAAETALDAAAKKTPDAAPVSTPRVVGLLLAIGALRIMPALGVPLTLAYLLKSAAGGNAGIGATQSLFMAGIGGGGILCAALVGRAQERRVLTRFPLLAAPLISGLSWVADPLPQRCLVTGAGLLLGVAMPVYISYGQQLLPRGQRVASSITMGVSWGISSALVAAAIWWFQNSGRLSDVFQLFAVACVSSSLLCRFLPHLARDA